MINARYWLANALAVIAVVASVIAGPGWFVRGTVYDTETFVTRVDEAADRTGVQNAVADHVVGELFRLAGLERQGSADETDEEDEEGQDEASATPTIVAALEQRATVATLGILESDRFRRTFAAAVRGSHQEFLSAVDTEPDDELIMIDLEPVLESAVDQLGRESATAFLGDVDVPPGSAQFVVVHEGQGSGILWTLLGGFESWATGALVLTLLCSGLAVAIAYERDRLLVAMGLGFGFVAVATAAIVWVARPLAGSIFIGDSIGRGAFNDVYRVVASPLYRQEIVVVVLSALMIAAGLVLGVIERRRHPVDEWLEYDEVYPPGHLYPPAYPPGQPVPPGRSW